MDSRTEYSPGINLKVSELQATDDSAELRASLYVNLPVIRHTLNTLLVVSFEHRDKPYCYTAVNLNDVTVRPGKWQRVSLEVPLPVFRSMKDQVKVYIWNPGKQLFYIDDLRFELAR